MKQELMDSTSHQRSKARWAHQRTPIAARALGHSDSATVEGETEKGDSWLGPRGLGLH